MLLVGGVALVKGRIKHEGPALIKARNEIEDALQSNAFLERAPFGSIGLILRFGSKDDLDPEFSRIDVSRDQLPVAVELDLRRLQDMSEDDLRRAFRLVFIEVMCDVAANYDLPYEFLDALRATD
jgi:hypothetical protein